MSLMCRLCLVRKNFHVNIRVLDFLGIGPMRIVIAATLSELIRSSLKVLAGNGAYSWRSWFDGPCMCRSV